MILRKMIWGLCFIISTATIAQIKNDSFRLTIINAKNDDQKIKAYIQFGEKVGQQKFDEVIFYGKEGIVLAQKNDDFIAIAKLQLHNGQAFYFKGNYDSAAHYFYASMAMFEKQGDKLNLANSYNALAKLYRKTRDLERSLANYDKAMAIFVGLNDSAGISMIYNESGVVFEYKGEYKKAADRYNASLKIDELRKNDEGICYALSNLAGVYALQNKYAIAEQYLMRTLNIRKLFKDSFALALNYADLGNTYAASKNFIKAILFIDTSIFIADKLNYLELIGNNYNVLGSIAEQQGDFAGALRFYNKKSTIKDSIFSIEKSKQIEELNTQYETEKKERKIEDQQNKITQQYILMIASAMVLMLIALLTYSTYKRKKWQQEAKIQADILIQQSVATKAVMQAEDAERARIAADLHDGVGQIMSAAKMNLSAFENTATLQTNEDKNSIQKIMQLIDEGCKEVRNVAHSMMPNALLKNNIAYAINEMVKSIHSNNLKVNFYNEGFVTNTTTNNEIMLFRILQECINNVLKHAQATSIDMSLIKNGNEITATIEDNGKGFDFNNNSDGIGLKNIRSRVEYLKGKLEINSAVGKGTFIALYITA